MRNKGVLIATLLLFTLGPMSGQQATLVGVVTDSLTGNPLAGASALVLGLGHSVTTGSDGRFQIGAVASGDLTLEIRKPGYRPVSVHQDLEIIGVVTVDLGTIRLSPLVVELEPVVVVDSAISQKLDRVGFYQRRHLGGGTFLTGEEIARLNPINTSDLLRRTPAFGTTLGGTGNVAYGVRGTASIRQAMSACLVTYYIDGVHAKGVLVDNVLPNAIVGIEMYTGPATIPLQFRTLTGNPNCGAVVIWTRTGGTRPGG